MVKELNGLPRHASCETSLRIYLTGKLRHGLGDGSHELSDDRGFTPNRFFADLQSDSAHAVQGNVGAQFDERKEV